MKARLCLMIDETLLSRIKSYAKDKNISVSELVEQYFHSITKSTKHENIIDMVEKLNPLRLNAHADLKKEFYEEQVKEMGERNL